MKQINKRVIHAEIDTMKFYDNGHKVLGGYELNLPNAVAANFNGRNLKIVYNDKDGNDVEVDGIDRITIIF